MKVRCMRWTDRRSGAMIGFGDFEIDGWLRLNGGMVIDGEHGRFIRFQGVPRLINGELVRNNGKLVYHDPMVEMTGANRKVFTEMALAAIEERAKVPA